MTTKTVLGTTVYGEPSGNYDGSSQDWYSDSVTAANYYRGRGGVQTITFSLLDFVGTMVLEACLDADPAAANWFTTFTYSSNAPGSYLFPETITGNFTWMRVRVEGFDDGTITSVTITY